MSLCPFSSKTQIITSYCGKTYYEIYYWQTTNGFVVPKGRDCLFIGHPDFVRLKLDRKSTSGTCILLGNLLVSLHIKKQTSILVSTAVTEYVDVDRYCAQII